MMPRPLYLDPAIAWEVRLDSGVTLAVSAPGRSRSLYPLQRLARVICGRHADWRTDALLACADAGVPVVFHDARGSIAAWCFGGRRREATLGQLVREGLSQPDWTDRFEAWATAAGRREMLVALCALGLGNRRLEPVHVRALICNRHRARLGQPAGPWLRALRQASDALAAEVVCREVGDASLLGFASPGLNLPREFGRLLEWRQHRIVHEWPAASLCELPPGRFAATAVERRSAMLHRGCGELLGDLERQLRDWLL